MLLGFRQFEWGCVDGWKKGVMVIRNWRRIVIVDMRKEDIRLFWMKPKIHIFQITSIYQELIFIVNSFKRSWSKHFWNVWKKQSVLPFILLAVKEFRCSFEIKTQTKMKCIIPLKHVIPSSSLLPLDESRELLVIKFCGLKPAGCLRYLCLFPPRNRRRVRFYIVCCVVTFVRKTPPLGQRLIFMFSLS